MACPDSTASAPLLAQKANERRGIGRRKSTADAEVREPGGINLQTAFAATIEFFGNVVQCSVVKHELMFRPRDRCGDIGMLVSLNLRDHDLGSFTGRQVIPRRGVLAEISKTGRLHRGI